MRCGRARRRDGRRGDSAVCHEYGSACAIVATLSYTARARVASFERLWSRSPDKFRTGIQAVSTARGDGAGYPSSAATHLAAQPDLDRRQRARKKKYAAFGECGIAAAATVAELSRPHRHQMHAAGRAIAPSCRSTVPARSASSLPRAQASERAIGSRSTTNASATCPFSVVRHATNATSATAAWPTAPHRFRACRGTVAGTLITSSVRRGRHVAVVSCPTQSTVEYSWAGPSTVVDTNVVVAPDCMHASRRQGSPSVDPAFSPGSHGSRWVVAHRQGIAVSRHARERAAAAALRRPAGSQVIGPAVSVCQ